MTTRFRAGDDKLTDITKAYAGAGTPSVSSLSLEVGRGGFLVLIGPSGCGKTTLLNMINRLVEPSSGRIEIAGVRSRTGPVQPPRHRLCLSGSGAFSAFEVAQNIAVTPRLLGWPEGQIAARVSEFLALVRLPDAAFATRLPRELSGGQRQRAALARALAARPAAMLLDEPFGALDPLTRDEIVDDYRRIHDALGLTTVMVAMA